VIHRAPTQQAVDFYMSSGFSQSGECNWSPDEIPHDAQPFSPVALRVRNPQGEVSDTMRSTDPITVELEYRLDEPIQALRLGIYLQTVRGEIVFTSFDTDSPEQYERYATRPAGHFLSRCQIPANLLNEGQYVVGINASAFRIKRYFQDERALAFSVDAAGAPGKQWGEVRLGPLRPDLNWQIEEAA
jgi:lipopolysaccharide transport system ATP-binding protein